MGLSLIFPMKKLLLLSSPSRRTALAGIFLTAALGGWVLAPTGYSQASNPMTSNAALTPLLTRLKAQQDELAANQTKIEAQTAALKEEIRQSKIYAGRSGGRR